MSSKVIARRAELALHELTPAIAAMLAPVAAMALALGLWAFFAQFAIASAFPIREGVLADWRSWMLIAGALEFTAWRVGSRL